MEYENKFVGLSSVMSHDLEILRYELEYGWKLALIPNTGIYEKVCGDFKCVAIDRKDGKAVQFKRIK